MIRDRGYKSGTVPEIPGQLEPMVIAGNMSISNLVYSEDGDNSILFLSSNVTINGSIKFANNIQCPITAYSSIINFFGNISFVNNTGTNGGAMALYSSTLNIAGNTSLHFINNTATDTGGAIYVNNVNTDFLLPPYTLIPCFYQLLDYDVNSKRHHFQFINNSASNGGDHIYGEAMHSCACSVARFSEDDVYIPVSSFCVQKRVFSYTPNSTESLSSVSSDPTRVCMCDDHGKPQCDKSKESVYVHPGDTFSISVVIVGVDLGTTVGSVYAISKNDNSVTVKPTIQAISSNKNCTKLSYTIFSRNMDASLYLTIKPELFSAIVQFIEQKAHNSYDCLCTEEDSFDEGIPTDLLYTPPLIKISLLSCPRGFTLLANPPACDCFHILTEHKVSCSFMHGIGYHIWNGSMWLNVDTNLNVLIAPNCPFDYCKNSQKVVSFDSAVDGSDDQCSFNRNGRLCGGCKDNFSLAIGSSHCLNCLNNKNLSLFVFFALAGFLLVLFISILNLTVTQGMINGLIFYANVIWTYQTILLPQNDRSYFLRVFIAWLNFDFGIESCFIDGLNAFIKTWLQYLFPLYTWVLIAGIVRWAKCSNKLSIGERSVSVLATLFLLSYTKLLKIIIDSLGFTPIKVFSNDTNYTLTVWSLDGNYVYGHFPHYFLISVALFALIFMWLPYTIILLLMQWLRRISHDRFLWLIPKWKPIDDAYFAPLKEKHQYWFGVLLITRGTLLLIFTSTYAVFPKINNIVLLVTAAALLCYSNYHRVYKRRSVQLSENYFLLLLVLLGGSGMLEDDTRNIMAYLTVAMGFLGFCGIIIFASYTSIHCRNNREVEGQREIAQPRVHFEPDNEYAQYRDSILNETEPLLDVSDSH